MRKSGRAGLSEEQGGRLALILAAIAPVRKPSRTTLIRSGVSDMSDEECLTGTPGCRRRRGIPARIMRLRPFVSCMRESEK